MSAKIQEITSEHTVGRSRIYALLAEAFSFPEGESVLRLLDGDLIAELKESLAQTTFDIHVSDTLALPATKNAIQEMQVIYTELFDVTGGTPKVSLLERRYCDTPEQELWEKLLRFYTHFGLDFSTEDVAEQPDHLLTELSFMHYLSFLEAGCQNDTDRLSLQRGQRDFLDLHLGSWTAPLSNNLSEQQIANPYSALGHLALKLTECDKAYFNATLIDDAKQDTVEQ